MATSVAGFRFGAVAYSSDLVDLPDASIEALAGLDLWIVDACAISRIPATSASTTHWPGSSG